MSIWHSICNLYKGHNVTGTILQVSCMESWYVWARGVERLKTHLGANSLQLCGPGIQINRTFQCESCDPQRSPAVDVWQQVPCHRRITGGLGHHSSFLLTSFFSHGKTLKHFATFCLKSLYFCHIYKRRKHLYNTLKRLYPSKRLQ